MNFLSKTLGLSIICVAGSALLASCGSTSKSEGKDSVDTQKVQTVSSVVEYIVTSNQKNLPVDTGTGAVLVEISYDKNKKLVRSVNEAEEGLFANVKAGGKDKMKEVFLQSSPLDDPFVKAIVDEDASIQHVFRNKVTKEEMDVVLTAKEIKDFNSKK